MRSRRPTRTFLSPYMTHSKPRAASYRITLENRAGRLSSMNLRRARVSRLFPEEGYGYLPPDGGEIYFHKNSVLNDEFEKLVVGTEVSFVEEAGDKGPQASTVRILGKKRGAGRA